MDRLEIIVLILELIGTVAFAVSGAFTAINKKMDIFGVIILALTTAVGGGIIRDLVLGITPPTTFRDPVYAILSIITANIVFLPRVRSVMNHTHPFYDKLMLISDSLGLGVFTVVGIAAAIGAGQGSNGFLCVFIGAVTGCGGGVMRDIMAGDMPYIFIKHVYATASICGAVLVMLLRPFIGDEAAMIIGAAVIFILRLLAAHYHWSLPRA